MARKLRGIWLGERGPAATKKAAGRGAVFLTGKWAVTKSPRPGEPGRVTLYRTDVFTAKGQRRKPLPRKQVKKSRRKDPFGLFGR